MSGGRKRGVSGKQIVSANLLLEGEVVYRTHAGAWSPRLSDAAVAETAEAATALLASAESEPHLVVDAALAAVDIDAQGRLSPLAHRERIRALGPTNRPDLGKQAQTGDGGAPAEAA